MTVENGTVAFSNLSVCNVTFELLTDAQPDDLCLVFVQLQAISGHTVTDPRNAHCHIRK